MIVLWLACTPEQVTGTLVDVRTGAGLSGLHVAATHVSGKCEPLSSEVVDGEFTFPKPCHGPYALSLDDPERTLLVEPGPLPASLLVRAWPIPAAATSGVFLAGDGGTVELAPIGRTREATLADASEVVRFPDVLPETWPLADGWVVVVGADLAGLDTSLVQLVDAPERRFGSDELPRIVPAWKYLDVTSDAPLGEGCLSDAASGRVLAGCPRSALAAGGDYAVVVGDRLAMFRLAP